MNSKISQHSDEKILQKCQQFGASAILYRRKFLGLIPEVYRRRLYERKNCQSIYEFASKFAGVSREQVDRVICIERVFSERGVNQLMDALVNGDVSMHKLARVVSVVTLENEAQLMHAVKNLPRESLEAYVRDMRVEMSVSVDQLAELRSDGTQAFELDLKFVHVHKNTPPEPQKQAILAFGEVDSGAGVSESENVGSRMVSGFDSYTKSNSTSAIPAKKLQLDISQDTLDQLLELQRKGIDVDGLLQRLLRAEAERISVEKALIAEKVTENESIKRESGSSVSRYIPVGVRSVLQQEFGSKCAIPNCTQTAVNIHHTARFSAGASHNPYYLAPLCKAHHDIAHLADMAFMQMKKNVVDR